VLWKFYSTRELFHDNLFINQLSFEVSRSLLWFFKHFILYVLCSCKDIFQNGQFVCEKSTHSTSHEYGKSLILSLLHKKNTGLLSVDFACLRDSAATSMQVVTVLLFVWC